MPIVQILLPTRVDKLFSYQVATPLPRGALVQASFGTQKLLGVVWQDGAAAADFALKTAVAVEGMLLPSKLCDFIDWMAGYTLTPAGLILKMTLGAASTTSKKTALYYAPQTTVANLSERQQHVIALAAEPIGVTALAAAAGVSPASVRSLIKAGWLVSALPAPPVWPQGWQPPVYSPAQAQAAQKLQATVGGSGFSVTLLDGVTGSGKTEVYYAAIQQALQQGKQSLVLLPEIALAGAWLQRFNQRFGFMPAVWHSDVRHSARTQTWRHAIAGTAPVIVGARSALFLPLQRLGLVVVDEEHDGSYKQEEGVIYQARDMAVARAQHEAAPIILASATPSLETIVNVQQGKYRHLLLLERYGQASLPHITLVDGKQEAKDYYSRRWLAEPTRAALRQTVAAGQQALIYLNRRGYAPLVLCRTCGTRVQCPHCTAWLVDHKNPPRWLCHHCGYTIPPQQRCTTCQAEHSFVPSGPGVERLAEEVQTLLPNARVLLLSSDSAPSAIALERDLERIARREVEVIIGTQLVAKGHHFPELTLAVVVDADAALSGADIRAGERTFQMLTQVAGRAGRETLNGQVLIQSFNPQHPTIQALAAYDRAAFYASEQQARLSAGMPPFGRLAAVLVTGMQEAAVQQYCRQLAKVAPTLSDGALWGPVPAPLSKVRRYYRWRFLLKAPRHLRLQPLIRDWLTQVSVPRGIKVAVDVDPYSFV